MNPLAELKDIHLPAAAPWWDIALGWWILAAGLVVLLWCGLPQIINWSKQRKTRKVLKLGLQEHFANIQETYKKEQNLHAALAAISIYLRRVALTVFGEEQSAGLIGHAWLNFLDQHWGEEKPALSFSSESIAVLLTDATYQKPSENITDEQIQQVFVLTQAWLDKVVKHHV